MKLAYQSWNHTWDTVSGSKILTYTLSAKDCQLLSINYHQHKAYNTDTIYVETNWMCCWQSYEIQLGNDCTTIITNFYCQQSPYWQRSSKKHYSALNSIQWQLKISRCAYNPRNNLISNINCCHRKPIWVFGGWQNWIPRLSNTTVVQTDAVSMICTCQGYLQLYDNTDDRLNPSENLIVWEESSGTPTAWLGIQLYTSATPGSTPNHCKAVYVKQHLLW